MKLNFADFPRKGQFPPLLALGAMPVCAMILAQTVPASVQTLPALLIAYVLLAWLCMALPGRLRTACCALGCAALLLLGLRLLPVTASVAAVNGSTVSVSEGVFTLLVPILLCGLLVYSLQFGAWPRERELPFNVSAAGVVAHLLAQFAVLMHRNLSPSPYDPVKPWLLACFIAYMPLMLLSFNRMSMLDAAQGRQRAPLTMRRRNAVMTLCFFALVLLVCAIPAIARAVERAWNALLAAIWAVIAWFINLLPVQSGGGGMGGPGSGDMFGPMESAEPSLLAVLLEKILSVVVMIVAAALLLLFLRLVFGKIAHLLRTLLARMRAYLSTVSEDYVDEVTDTREDGSQRISVLASLRERMAFVNERRLPPAERIRYRYRRLLKKHPDWHESRTARESLPGDPAQRYERARYSGQEIAPEEAERFAQEIRDL